MQPTLNPDIYLQSQAQDYAIVDKDGVVDYGDIVIILKPDEPESGASIIKRVVAFEGDRISIIKTRGEDGLYYYHLVRIKSGSDEVEIVEEDYINRDGILPDWENLTPTSVGSVTYERTFYQNYFNLFGVFYDSSRIERHEVNGQSVLFYRLGEDEIFYMGDNRAHSTDAREFGPVTMSDMVIGKVVKIVENGAYSDMFFVRGYYQLKGILEYFFPKLLDYFAWKG